MNEEPHRPGAGRPGPTASPGVAADIMGGILVVFGILIMGLSGLCVGVVFLGRLLRLLHGSPGDIVDLLDSDIVIAGIPLAFGFLFFWLGRRIQKGASKR